MTALPPRGDPGRWTFADAVDPAATHEVLTAIVRDRPDLRALVAINPAASAEVKASIAAASPAGSPDRDAMRRQAQEADEPGADVVPAAPEADPPDEVSQVPADRLRRIGSRGLMLVRLRRRSSVVAIAAACLLAAFAGGAVTGWTAQAEVQSRRVSAEPRVVEVPVNSQADVDGVLMPDVRGMPLDDARQVIGDAGIAVEALTVDEQPAAGPPGTVVAQTPAFDTADPAAVVLTVSTVAVVPAVEGRPGDEVTDEIALLGAEVETVRQYVPGVPAGTAVGVAPAPGQPLPSAVTLTVAEAGGSAFLTSLRAVDGGCSSGPRDINGTTFENTLSCSTGGIGQGGQESAWVVGRHVDVLEASVGVPDDAEPGTTVLVEVLADGAVVTTARASYGTSTPLSARVTGALRLGVRVTLLATGDTSSFSGGSAALGDARLLGSVDGIAALAGS